MERPDDNEAGSVRDSPETTRGDDGGKISGELIRFQPVVAPPHELVSNVAHDLAVVDLGLDPPVAVAVTRRERPTGTHFEPALRFARRSRTLEQERQDGEIGVRSRSVVVWSLVLHKQRSQSMSRERQEGGNTHDPFASVVFEEPQRRH